MKVNIKKFQQGGGFATFTPYISAAAAATIQPTVADTSKKSETLADDDIFKEFLKEGGLPNDVDA